jgi:hypothetical protein
MCERSFTLSLTLATLDSNTDGVIDTQDTQFADLLVWRDLNADGASAAHELFSLSDLGIASIDLDYTSETTAVGGNYVVDVSTYTRTDSTTGEIADVYFATDTTDTIERDPGVTIAPEIEGLPFLRGFAEVSDLDIAMARDPLLKEMVADLAALTVNDAHLLASKVDAMLYRWLGVDGARADGRGTRKAYRAIRLRGPRRGARRSSGRRRPGETGRRRRSPQRDARRKAFKKCGLAPGSSFCAHRRIPRPDCRKPWCAT